MKVSFSREKKNLHEHALCFNLPHHTAKNYAACTRHWVLKLTSAASEITLNHQRSLLETKEIVSKNSKEKWAKKHETTQS